MATANRKRIPWLGIVLALVAIFVVAWWLFGDNARSFAKTGTAYGAKTACSCRYISGRDLDSCGDDFISGMALIMLSEDEAARSVTASMPLVADNTAQFREGFGCVLEPWEG